MVQAAVTWTWKATLVRLSRLTAAAGADDIFVDGVGAAGVGATAITVNSGAGADRIAIDYDIAGATTTVTVNAGDDNDRVQLISDTNIKGSVTLDGGNGIDTLAVTSNGAAINTIAGSVSNFEILEVTNVLQADINLSNYAGSNNINHVILDIGWTGTHEISGANSGFQLDLLDDTNGDLTLTLNNAVNNTNDAVKLVLNETSANGGGGGDFGDLHVQDIELMTIESTGEVSNLLVALPTVSTCSTRLLPQLLSTS